MGMGDTRRQRVYRWISSLFLLGILILNLSWAVRGTFSRDENYTLGGGQLVTMGAMPYRDFPYTHQPYLAFIYGGLFRLTDYPLLAARFFSAACSAATAVLVFFLVLDALRKHDLLLRYGIAWASVSWLAANPLYAYSAGLAWNHPPAIFLMLLAAALLMWGLRHTSWPKWLFVSGLFLGLATGIRVSAILMVIPSIIIVLWSSPRQSRRALTWIGGYVLALLPSVVCFLLAPQSYIFGNVTYHQLSKIYWQGLKPDEAYTLFQRLEYFGRNALLQPGNLFLLLLLLFYGGLAIWPILREPQRLWSDYIFWWLLFPFVIAGSFIVSPAHYQYFSVIVPFAIVTALFSLAAIIQVASHEGKRMILWLFFLCVLLVMSNQAVEFKRITFLLYPNTWRPLIFHNLGQQIDALAPEGKILTLTPQFAVEAGRSIYPPFAAGPFAWRITPQLNDVERVALGLIGDDELDSYMASDPPAGILVGLENELDAPLIAYARSHGYTEHIINQDIQLWLLAPQE